MFRHINEQKYLFYDRRKKRRDRGGGENNSFKRARGTRLIYS